MRVTRVVDTTPPIGGGAIFLGGEYRPETVLPRDGSAQIDYDPDAKFSRGWIERRVAELTALFDNPLYSFFEGVEAATRITGLRTTSLMGQDAVNELFVGASPGGQLAPFYHALPSNTLDKQRIDNDHDLLAEDTVNTKPPTKLKRMGGGGPPPSKKQTTPAESRYPVVGKIGDPEDDDDAPPVATLVPRSSGPVAVPSPAPPPLALPVSPMTAPAARYDDDDDEPPVATAAPRSSSRPPLAPPIAQRALAAAAQEPRLAPVSQSTLEALEIAAGQGVQEPANAVELPNAPAIRSGLLEMDPAAVPQNPAIVEARPIGNDGKKVAVRVDDANVNVEWAPGHFDHNVSRGDVVATRRIVRGQQMTESDLKLWSIVYNNGIGVTAPVPKQSADQLQSVRAAQLSKIRAFAATIQDASELSWQLLPEHLRTLFLSPEARMALEHATWIAHYQQPWNPSNPFQDQIDANHRRLMVPAIDLMTHEQVRVPFQTLVCNVLIYWRQRRSPDKARAAETLDAINNLVVSLSRMTTTPEGYAMLTGHYDVEAMRSRHRIEERRSVYLNNTGTFWSDLSRSVYSGAQVPTGRHMAAALHSMRRMK